jgi:hypothetical protein
MRQPDLSEALSSSRMSLRYHLPSLPGVDAKPFACIVRIARSARPAASFLRTWRNISISLITQESSGRLACRR